MKLNRSALIALRESSGLSQSGLGRRVGLTQGYISELERGAKGRDPRPETIQKLATGLGVSMSALVSRNGSNGSLVALLGDELADALEDKERIEVRIQRLEDRIAHAIRAQDSAPGSSAESLPEPR